MDPVVTHIIDITCNFWLNFMYIPFFTSILLHVFLMRYALSEMTKIKIFNQDMMICYTQIV